MYEDITIVNGSLVVSREPEDLVVDLSEVKDFYYERPSGTDPRPGALVVQSKDGELHVIRVHEDDAPTVVETLRAALVSLVPSE